MTLSLSLSLFILHLYTFINCLSHSPQTRIVPPMLPGSWQGTTSAHSSDAAEMLTWFSSSKSRDSEARRVPTKTSPWEQWNSSLRPRVGETVKCSSSLYVYSSVHWWIFESHNSSPLPCHISVIRYIRAVENYFGGVECQFIIDFFSVTKMWTLGCNEFGFHPFPDIFLPTDQWNQIYLYCKTRTIINNLL